MAQEAGQAAAACALIGIRDRAERRQIPLPLRAVRQSGTERGQQEPLLRLLEQGAQRRFLRRAPQVLQHGADGHFAFTKQRVKVSVPVPGAQPGQRVGRIAAER